MTALSFLEVLRTMSHKCFKIRFQDVSKCISGINLFKVNNRNIKTTCKICSKLTINMPERRHWCHTGVFIVNFEQILFVILVFLLMNLNKWMLAGYKSLNLHDNWHVSWHWKVSLKWRHWKYNEFPNSGRFFCLKFSLTHPDDINGQ